MKKAVAWVQVGLRSTLGLLVVGAALVTLGCAAPGRSDYESTFPTEAPTLVRDITLNEPFEAVWDRIVRNMSSSFFVINNIDKASRLINISFSSQQPEEYVDCGKTRRTYSYAKENATYEYYIAASSAYKAAGKWGPYQNLPVTYEMTRSTSLDGRINVYVAPEGPKTTKVVVNVRYIWTVSTSGTAHGYNAMGELANTQPIPSNSSTVSFGSAERGKSAHAQYPITCVSKGKLEKDLLAMASRR